MVQGNKEVETEIACEIKAVSMNKPQKKKKKKNKVCMRENPFQSALPNKVRFSTPFMMMQVFNFVIFIS